MLGVVVRRLSLAIPLMVIISLIVFVLGSLAPVASLNRCLVRARTPEAVEELNHQLGADRPVLVQYWSWLEKRCTGDLGTSIVSGRPVTELLAARLPVTLSLALGALLLVIVLGVSVGDARGRPRRVRRPHRRSARGTGPRPSQLLARDDRRPDLRSAT